MPGVKAFAVLKPGRDASGRQADELRHYVKRWLSAHAYPRETELRAQPGDNGTTCRVTILA